MKLNFVLIASFFFCSMLSQIEIPLYKTSTAYEELSKPEATIDDIDKTHFLVDLNLGTPSKSYPLQVEMAKEDIFIVNEKIIYLKKIPNHLFLKKWKKVHMIHQRKIIFL